VADNPNPHSKKSILQLIKDNSFLLGITIALASGGYTAWNDVVGKANAADAGVSKNVESIVDLKEKLELRSSKFLTDREFVDLWEEVEDNSENIDEMEANFNALIISDERINAKIVLESEKLRREIQTQSAAQTTILNQILSTVRSTGN
jgi:hypothetical protein